MKEENMDAKADEIFDVIRNNLSNTNNMTRKTAELVHLQILKSPWKLVRQLDYLHMYARNTLDSNRYAYFLKTMESYELRIFRTHDHNYCLIKQMHMTPRLINKLLHSIETSCHRPGYKNTMVSILQEKKRKYHL